MKLGQLSNMDLARLAIFLFEACNKANSEEEEKKTIADSTKNNRQTKIPILNERRNLEHPFA